MEEALEQIHLVINEIIKSQNEHMNTTERMAIMMNDMAKRLADLEQLTGGDRG